MAKSHRPRPRAGHGLGSHMTDDAIVKRNRVQSSKPARNRNRVTSAKPAPVARPERKP